MEGIEEKHIKTKKQKRNSANHSLGPPFGAAFQGRVPISQPDPGDCVRQNTVEASCDPVTKLLSCVTHPLMEESTRVYTPTLVRSCTSTQSDPA